ncbi:MAG: tyrosine-type recombinase/integrase [Streptosporangiaceae bacterium]
MILTSPSKNGLSGTDTGCEVRITPDSGQYVFVNLFAEPRGAPLRYPAVQALVSRLREQTGIEFTCHTLRHSHATDLIRRGVPIEVVSKRLTHSSVTTTSAAYVHLQAEDMRAELVRAVIWREPGTGAQP